MRTVITILAILPWIGAIAQGDGTIALITSFGPLDSAGVRTSRWSGSGGSFAALPPEDTGHVRASRWSGRGGTFRLGEPIEPMPLRAITWEFGDGSLSHILPPRPWRPSDGIRDPSASMAPFRERNGGSPCVAAAQGWPCEERATEPRPSIISESGQPVLITTGLGVRYLRVRMLEAMGRDRAPAVVQRFVPGRWAFGGNSNAGRPVFITLQDLSTGERWRAGVDL